MTTKKTYSAVFAEGEFESIEEHNSLDEAFAFSRGLARGARLYGAGSCCAYILPTDEAEMVKDESPGAAAQAIEAYAAAARLAPTSA